MSRRYSALACWSAVATTSTAHRHPKMSDGLPRLFAREEPAPLLGCTDSASGGKESDQDPYRKHAFPNRPPHFMDSCVSDGGTCDAPYECLPTEFVPDDGICSIPCERNSDCPRWREPGGHCRGDVQAQCLDHVCQAWCL
jgi:hypothetical protein